MQRDHGHVRVVFGEASSGDADTDESAAQGAAAPKFDDVDKPAAEEAVDDEIEGDGERSVSEAVNVAPSPRQIVYTIDLAIETDDVTRAAARAASLVEAAGGFVSRETMHGSESATLTLRVPAARHTEIVSDLEELGEVRERSRSAEDVTSEVVDSKRGPIRPGAASSGSASCWTGPRTSPTSSGTNRNWPAARPTWTPCSSARSSCRRSRRWRPSR